MEYPPNSDKSKTPDGPDDRNISRVTTEEPRRRKKGLRRQVKETLFSGDARTSFQYGVFNILIPSAQETIVELGSEFIRRLVVGETRKRGSTPPQSGATGYVSYDRYAMGRAQATAPRAISPRARAAHNFDEIVLQSRPEAEEVIDKMFDILSRYETVTVSDFYALVGLGSNHTDQKWGWTELRGAGVARVRGGYLLDLPEPKPLD